jgi:hypothetical protein
LRITSGVRGPATATLTAGDIDLHDAKKIKGSFRLKFVNGMVKEFDPDPDRYQSVAVPELCQLSRVIASLL